MQTEKEERKTTERKTTERKTTERKTTYNFVKGTIPDDDYKRFEFITHPLSGNISLKELRDCKTVTEALKDPDYQMSALEYHGKQDIRLVTRPKPMITQSYDAIIRVTATSISGADLHLYNNSVPGLESGDVLGHECMGIVESIGDKVQNLKIGDRVVVSAVISDGKCFYCQQQQYSLCDNTNPSKQMEELYGHRTAGIFGYSHLTGGYDGGQAEFIRVPHADFNTLKVPNNLPDEKVLFLSDVLCTGWHANELGGVCEGDNVAIWGAGPAGLLTALWAKFRKANRVILIDNLDYRLNFAKRHLGVDVIDNSKENVKNVIDSMIPHGPDVCIDCVGFRCAASMMQTIQMTLKLEKESCDVLNEMIRCVRKGGTLSVIGDYFQRTNNFLIGALMEKGLTLRGGQTNVQKYWKQLLGYVEQGLVDPSFIVTHRFPLEKAVDAYKIFDKREDNVIKVLLNPNLEKTQKREEEKHISK